MFSQKQCFIFLGPWFSLFSQNKAIRGLFKIIPNQISSGQREAMILNSSLPSTSPWGMKMSMELTLSSAHWRHWCLHDILAEPLETSRCEHLRLKTQPGRDTVHDIPILYSWSYLTCNINTMRWFATYRALLCVFVCVIRTKWC